MARKPLSFLAFRKLLTHISEHHRFSRGGWKIKYVTPHIDMRYGDIHCVQFRGMFGEKDFSITNENKERDLEKWIYDWLEERE